jgi:CheY-like chemotaxis protein
MATQGAAESAAASQAAAESAAAARAAAESARGEARHIGAGGMRAEDVQAVRPAAQEQAPAPTTCDGIVAHKPREETLVMIADDSKIVRVKTGRLLTANRYQVCFAEDGLDAVRQIRERAPDILITDVEMPGMDGFELTEHVRRSPSTARMPVIMVTAAEDRHRDHAARVGVNVLLGKPYPEQELLASIAAELAACSSPSVTFAVEAPGARVRSNAATMLH